MKVQIKIDGREFVVPEGLPVRKAAIKNGIYVPGICGHPYLPSVREVRWVEKVYRGDEVIIGDYSQETAAEIGNCNLCLVKIEGEDELVRACETEAREGMVVRTRGDDINIARRRALAKILANHPHACLTCAQKEGCSLTQCSANVPEDERCCILLNRCELGKIVDFVGLPEGTPKYVPEGFPKLLGDPFFDRDYNLCISCLRCVRVCGDVRGVGALGATYKDDRIWLGTVNPGALAESYCRFCGACVEVCPTGALQDKADAKPVRKGEAPPCIDACPAGIDIPAYVRRIAEGDYSGALKVVYNKAPFPGILGYVCFHPCEEACKREVLDESVAICALKRFVYEHAPREDIHKPEKGVSTGKKAVVIGAGPAGLSAAYYLAIMGYEVEVFDRAEKPGGMLRYAIPEYRLPLSVVDDEIRALEELGVVFKMNTRLGVDIKLDELLSNSYDAVLLAVGASSGKRLGAPGEELEGVIQTLDLLGAVRQGKAPELHGKVIVIGGGDVAVDGAMTVGRLGADEVTMVCLEGRDEMPAHDWEIQQATEEGIVIKPGWGPVEFIGEDGRLAKIRFKRCTKVFDDAGRFAPEYDEQYTMEMEADFAVVTIGQQVDGGAFKGAAGLKFGAGGVIEVDSDTLAAGVKGLYAAGDAVIMPGSVIEAVASGWKAADSIDKFLGGEGIIDSREPDEVRDNPFLGKDENFHKYESQRQECLNPDERIINFEVIEKTFTTEQAETEALRCLRCHLRVLITPVFMPPDKWQALTVVNIAAAPASEGVYLLADEGKKVIKIAGTAYIRAGLEAECDIQAEGTLFCWEEDKMYSKRESELIQKHLQEYGEMPGGEEDELF